MTYCPISKDINFSSVWEQPPHIRIAWITILAKKDQQTHIIETNPYLLSRMARISQDEAVEALEYFQKPDANSRSTEEGGRKLKRLNGNEYLVVTGAKYAKLAEEWMQSVNEQSN